MKWVRENLGFIQTAFILEQSHEFSLHKSITCLSMFHQLKFHLSPQCLIEKFPQICFDSITETAPLQQEWWNLLFLIHKWVKQATLCWGVIGIFHCIKNGRNSGKAFTNQYH